jgi:hypothetical protein
VLVLDVSSPVEDSVEHSFHTQHERFLPAPTSRAVTALAPIRKAITPATILLMSIALLREGERDKNQENGAVTIRRTFFKENRARALPGMFFTVPGARCKYVLRMSLTVVATTADIASPTMVPATPKREVRRAASGAATPPAAILAGSIICCFCWLSKRTPSSLLLLYRYRTHQNSLLYHETQYVGYGHVHPREEVRIVESVFCIRIRPKSKENETATGE